MVKIDFEKYIKDRIWFGYYWTGTIFPIDSGHYWCKLADVKWNWSIAVDVRGFKNWG